MAWSTRELAELAGTSLRSVRHYHEVGLLPEPERRANGYKQYGVAHLVRLVRIKRLTDLGFSLPQIADLGDADEHPTDALRTLDSELAAQIDRLQQARGELAAVLEQSVPTDLPAELAVASARDLPANDRQFVSVMGRVLGPGGLAIYAGVLDGDDPTDGVAGGEFENLPEDADDAVRADLAGRLVEDVRRLELEHPGMLELGKDAPRGARHHRQTVDRALAELYNPAQLDVLLRVRKLLVAPARSRATGSAPTTRPDTP